MKPVNEIERRNSLMSLLNETMPNLAAIGLDWAYESYSGVLVAYPYINSAAAFIDSGCVRRIGARNVGTCISVRFTGRSMNGVPIIKIGGANGPSFSDAQAPAAIISAIKKMKSQS